jgi:hypothetical protein
VHALGACTVSPSGLKPGKTAPLKPKGAAPSQRSADLTVPWVKVVTELWQPTPLPFLCKCSFQTSLRSQLLEVFIPKAARVLVLEAAEGGIGHAANFALLRNIRRDPSLIRHGGFAQAPPGSSLGLSADGGGASSQTRLRLVFNLIPHWR